MQFGFATVLHSVPITATESKTTASSLQHERFDQVQAHMGVKMKNKKIPILSLMPFFNALKELHFIKVLLPLPVFSSYTEINTPISDQGYTHL